MISRKHSAKGRFMATEQLDAVIIGAGHNGLVAAGYLARAGKKVLVLEQRDYFGSDYLRAAFAGQGVIGTFIGPKTPGSVYVN
jgi:phytoene dehydrogenase-like protein